MTVTPTYQSKIKYKTDHFEYFTLKLYAKEFFILLFKGINGFLIQNWTPPPPRECAGGRICTRFLHPRGTSTL